MSIEGFGEKYNIVKGLVLVEKIAGTISSGHLFDYLMEIRGDIRLYIKKPSTRLDSLAEALRKLDVLEDLVNYGWRLGLIKKGEELQK